MGEAGKGSAYRPVNPKRFRENHDAIDWHREKPVEKTTVVNLQVFPFDIYIGRRNASRGLPESKWHNPFRIGPDGTREEVLEKYRKYVLGREDLMKSIGELRGKVLGCWCSPAKCHGDILAELANSSL